MPATTAGHQQRRNGLRTWSIDPGLRLAWLHPRQVCHRASHLGRGHLMAGPMQAPRALAAPPPLPAAEWQHPYVNVFKLCGALCGPADGVVAKDVEKAGRVAEKLVRGPGRATPPPPPGGPATPAVSSQRAARGGGGRAQQLPPRPSRAAAHPTAQPWCEAPANKQARACQRARCAPAPRVLARRCAASMRGRAHCSQQPVGAHAVSLV